jgi:extracellular elastinolytic metalloproteinase
MTRRGQRLAVVSATAALAVAVTSALPSSAAAEGNARPHSSGSGIVDHDSGHLADLDARPAAAQPDATQRAAADNARRAPSRGAAPATVTWNRFGSAASIRAVGGAPLATGLGRNPVSAARAYLVRQAEILGVSASDVARMEHLTTNQIGTTDVVMLRQVVDGVPAGMDGLVVVAVEDGAVRYLTSTLAPTRGSARVAAPRLSAEQALGRAAGNIGRKIAEIRRAEGSTGPSADAGWTALTAEGLLGTQHVKQVAVPVPGDGTRLAYHVVTRAAQDSGYSVYVDAVTGEVIARDGLVDHDSDNPRWSVFTSVPEVSPAPADTRVQWCWTSATGCSEPVDNPASPLAWDVDPLTKLSTTTTSGNNATSGERWVAGSTVTPATPSSERSYTYPFTGQWTKERCNPSTYASAQRNDIDAATANLFASHNRMHDWSYQLGFTETAWNMQRDNFGKGGLGGDPELGYSQSGAKTGSRNNANQGTPPDGISGYSNMYLWQPLAGSFYAPCVDGDYDMSVIGHEYGHAISNRMAGGPDRGLSGLQAGAMGESWSDLMATEYLQEQGYVPFSETATPMGAYVTGNAEHGIRNFNFSKSPLNYSNVGYDLTGPQVHADGEIWSATNSDIRKAFIARHGAGDAAMQKSCAAGATPVAKCPGNRRWMQLVFDAWLLMPSGAVSMLDARDAMLAADQIRFAGGNQDLLWDAFASRGMGRTAASNGSTDHDPVPSFESPHSRNATLRFVPTDEDGVALVGAKLYVGEFTGRSRPVADTDPATELGNSFTTVPGIRTYTVTAPGYGQTTFTFAADPGQNRAMPVPLATNLASSAAGATLVGEGTKVTAANDGDEATTATTVDQPSAAQKVFTVDLAGGRHVVRRVQVSALPEPGSAGRFQALRQFRVWACDAKDSVLCDRDGDYRLVYTSPTDAFPGTAPRPVAPELRMRSFEIPQTAATHLRFELAANQCQAGPAFQGEQDEDPQNATDCRTAYSGAQKTAVTEVQVLRR